MADEALDDLTPPNNGQEVLGGEAAASDGSNVDQIPATQGGDGGIAAPASMPSDSGLEPASTAGQPPTQTFDDSGGYGGSGQWDDSVRQFALRETALQMIRDDPVAMNCLQWHHVKVRPDGTRLGFDEVTGQYWPVPPVSEAALRRVLGPHFADVKLRLSTIPLVTASAPNYGFGGTPDPAAADRSAAQAIDVDEERTSFDETMATDAGNDTSPVRDANTSSRSDGGEDTITAKASADEPLGAQLAQAAPATAGRSAIAAEGAEDRVEYTNRDGSRDVYEGGTRPWRTRNPGSIMYGPFARRHGAIGVHTVPGEIDLAIFPNRETGTRAQRALLAGPRYQALTIDVAIATYSDTNVANYQDFVRRALNLPGTTPMRSLTAAQLDQLVNAMQRFENTRPGTVHQIPPPQ